MDRQALHSQRGDLLIDAIIGTVLVGLAVALIGPLFSVTGISRESTRKQTEAANLASTILEDTQGVPFSSVTSSGLAPALVEGKYPNIGTPAQAGWQVTRGGTTYSISLTVSEVPETGGHARHVTVSLTWPGGGKLSRATSVTDSLTSSLPAKPAAGSWITEFLYDTEGSSCSIDSGPDGNLWFVESTKDRIGKITPSGAITLYSLPYLSRPEGITLGPDNNLWFTNNGTNKVGKITTSGAVTEYSTNFYFDHPVGITAGPDGNLWVTASGASYRVGKVTTSGAMTKYSLPLSSNPKGITAGPDGNLWFTEYGTNKIGRITPSGTITEFPIPTANSKPDGITAGPDGNLWFAEHEGKIGRITPSGTITEFPASAASGLCGITSGPDGNLWFTENYIGEIGRISPGE